MYKLFEKKMKIISTGHIKFSSGLIEILLAFGLRPAAKVTAFTKSEMLHY